jgi:nucleotide-binding universal stress UspA family protein
MSWKDILVFADGSEDGLTRLKLAMDIARAHDAHLEAQIVTALPQRPYGPASAALEDAFQEVLRAIEQRAADALAAVNKTAPPGETFSAYRCDGPFSHLRSLVAVAARSADLVVLGQPEATDASDIDTEILMGALFGGGQPCLMLPRWVSPHIWGRRALIAWKATPQAARAVQAALPLLKRAESVRLLTVDPRAEREGEDRRSLMRLATHLSRHDVEVEGPDTTQSEFGDAARAIAEEIEVFRADLLVMGAYGRARVNEFVFGGVSRAMIRDARIAVLMSH